MPRLRPRLNLRQNVASWNLTKITRYLLIIAAVLAVVTLWFWYTQVYLSKERRFWLAIENSLSTPSVVRTLTDGGSGNQVVQQYRFHYTPQQVIENKVEYTNKSSTVDTHVVTEGIIFPDSQFLRYNDFVNQANGNELANIDNLLGQWAGQDAEDAEESRLNYLGEYVTLVVFGNFNAEQRSDLLKRLHEKGVYKSDFSAALEDVIDDEKVLTYNVSVSLPDYVEILQDSFKAAGYGDFPPLDVDNYREGSTINASIAVRKRDNVVVGVNFGGREERYSNYGVLKSIEAPVPTYTIEELQEKVQELIQ